MFILFACLFVVFRPTREFYTRLEMFTTAGEELQTAGATNGKFGPVNSYVQFVLKK